MARERAWNSRRKSSSHAHTSQVFAIDSTTRFLASVIYLLEKMGRMNGGEKSEGRLDLTENSLEHCRNADP